MIARIWHGVTAASKAEVYVNYLKETGVRAYRATPGNKGVFVLRRMVEGRAEFLLMSLWDSMEAIRRFAGTEVEKAVYYPKDRDFLLELEPKVVHYDVAVAQGPAAER